MQADLFNISLSNSIERQAFQRAFFDKKYTLRTDQLLAIALVMVVFFVLVFAWGMEHGKAVSHREIMFSGAQVAAQAQVASEPQAPSAPVISESVTPLPPVTAAIEIANGGAPEALAVPPSVSAPVKAKYTIAHIIYLKKDQAKKEVDKITAKGQTAKFVSSGRYFQIIVGGFESRKAANEAMKSLQMQGIVSPDSYVRNMPAAA